VEYIEPDQIPYYSDCEPLISGFGYRVVELAVFRKQTSWQVKIVITCKDGVGINECTKVHRAVLARLEAILATEDIYIEVTSPGIDRVLKSASEFALFEGKTVKVWNTDISDWMSGTVITSGKDSVTLSSEKGEIEIPYSKIAKAKLFDRA
jgi:ribosome maturation factor RimP